MRIVHRNGHEIKVNPIECADARFVIFWDLFEQGWETSTIDTLDKYLTPDTTYIDLGAWIGPTVLYAAPLCKQCYAFEPDPLAYRQLKANVELNGFTNVTTFNEAVLDYNGTAAFGNDNLGNSMSRIEHPNKMFSAPCRTLDSFAIEYPLTSPLFIKVDIEGADLQALATLTAATAPTYISLELNCADPIVERLIELGYSAFKFVNAETYWPTPPVFNHQIGWRLLRKVRRAPFVRKAISKVGRRLRPNSEYDPPYKYSPTGYPFGRDSSGPFGEQAAGNWLTSEAALGWFGKLKNNFLREGIGKELWWDVHARHS